MDTFAEISCFAPSQKVASNAINETFNEIKRLENLFNRFDEKSELSKVNRLAGIEKISVDPDLFEIIKNSLYYSKISKGNFDITVTPLVGIWSSARKKDMLPNQEIIERTLKYVGYENIILDEKDLSVHFLNNLTKIDLGGIAKGYAIDKAKEILHSYGIQNALINIGGNIFAMGNPLGKKDWEIGIQHPREKDKIIARLKLKNKAISTSGDYERFFVLEGRRFSHIINPSNGYPSEGIISVTIAADSAEKADILSTAVFVMGIEDGINFIESFKDVEVFIFDKDAKLIKYPQK